MKIDLDTQIFPQFKLSTQQDLILYLIKNELVGTRFINQLASVGFDTSFFSVELGMAILSLMGFKTRTDTLWEWYHDTVDLYAAKICLDDHAVTRAVTFDFYIALRIKLHSEQG